MAHPPFGRALRPLWALEPGATFLNHGSYGAVPKSVLAEQARIRAAMEAQPDQFFRNRVHPRTDEPTDLRRAAHRLAAFVGAAGDSLAFMENATSAVEAALQSVELAPGDHVLITDHTYNAVRLMVEARCRQTGAEPLRVRIALPATADSIAAAFEEAAGPRIRLAILDHITSPTALLMPLDRIIPRLRALGATVIVDGAHAVGQVPLDVPAIGADWYTSNAHKWLYAARGSAFLWASSAAAARTRPLVVSHYVDKGFPFAFDWVGTRDCSAWLAVPAAIDFHTSLGWDSAREHQRGLLAVATDVFAGLGAAPVADEGVCASMRAFTLPQRRAAIEEDRETLMRDLWERERIQAMAVAFGGRLLLRVSAQAYVDEEDVRALGAALERGGWPGR